MTNHLTPTVEHSTYSCPRNQGDRCSVCDWLDRTALERGELPLGYCTACIRVRWITPRGNVCTQCAREGTR